MGLDNTGKNRGRMTRRALLGSGAVAGVAGVAATLGTGVAAAPQSMPDSWDEEVDVVVIGSGFAGLAAAHEAAKAGASVALLEKMRVPGGNSIINGGLMAIAAAPMQAEKGIEDSPELMMQDMKRAGLNLNHDALVRTVAEQSADMLQWTIDELGVEYVDVSHLGGHSVPRAYVVKAGSGSGIVVPQLDKLKELGVEPRMGTLLKHLLRDEDGRVKGVQVHEGYRFPDEESGTPKTIKARKAVVLATGGFGNDLAFRMMQDPRLDDTVDSTNQPGATAEAMRDAMDIGCLAIQPSWIQLGPWSSPDEKGFGIAPLFVVAISGRDGIWINTTTGKRFVNELADRKIRADAIIAIDNKAIALVDAPGLQKVRDNPGVYVDKLLERGILREFASLEDLAAAYEIPVDDLKATFERFNASVEAGADDELGRPMQPDQATIGTAPYYAVRLRPKIHHTMGGLAMNAEAQALDVASGDPIAGLYVAGEVAGGVHGASRLGSCAITDCLVFGRIAGRNAAAEENWG